jgi:hypothetical protein
LFLCLKVIRVRIVLPTQEITQSHNVEVPAGVPSMVVPVGHVMWPTRIFLPYAQAIIDNEGDVPGV